MHKFRVDKVAILGAGVMGAQIAAHFANAGFAVLLFDIDVDGKPTSQIGLDKLHKINPKPFALDAFSTRITPLSYNHIERLSECSLVIEAIIEDLSAKRDLLLKVSNHVALNSILASNTSGISITALAACLPLELRSRFCGIHFFNPPRYMSLVELIPYCEQGDLMSSLEEFLVTRLGKTVVIAKDTPNFIANRLGVFSMLSTVMHAEKYGIPFEVVDAITGKNLARAKSATFRTVDLVGLDVLIHVVNTMRNCDDNWQQYYVVPAWISNLAKQGCLGQKTGAGVFKKTKDGLYVFDIKNLDYRLADKTPSKEILEILSCSDWAMKLNKIKNSDLPEAKFIWACFKDIFLYAADMLSVISDNPHDMDIAIRAGFGWKFGIFELWCMAGWHNVIDWMLTDTNISLPSWVSKLPDSGIFGVNSSYRIGSGFVEYSMSQVYDRQIVPNMVLGETLKYHKHVVYENDGVCLWHTGDDIGILSFKSKLCVIGNDVLLGLNAAIALAEEQLHALIIWQDEDIFSAGANLEEFGFAIMMNGASAVDSIIQTGHNVIAKRIRSSSIPVIAAVKGYAFGGGCEIMLHADAVVAALESYIGLVEVGVGLLPGWGGTTELSRRASLSVDPWKALQNNYKMIAMAKVSTSAYEALDLGLLNSSDTIVINTKELLWVAKQRAKYMSDIGYVPPLLSNFEVCGLQGIANMRGLLINMYVGQQISEHDMLIATNIAEVMCGGYIEKSVVNQDWMLALELEKFKQLALSPETEKRIQYMLEHGKPLRN